MHTSDIYTNISYARERVHAEEADGAARQVAAAATRPRALAQEPVHERAALEHQPAEERRWEG